MSPTMFTYANVLTTLFVQTPGDNKNPGSNFLGMNSPGDYFDYLNNVLLPGLYQNWEKRYNDDTSIYEGFGFIFYENKLQGVPRLRQVRVTNQSCFIPDDFKSQIKSCYASYSQKSVDTEPFGVKNGTAIGSNPGNF
ncbi:hypothetical protein HELRODRAFT_171408 [Helobdella robusta]|uniref:Polycystin domain-containing protein n=1 Tax=Helobdella robusta TaxID=6412 RepID=T1F487_HELRO|nr:hypothetical protein HELRODRAFT_171408 [Helobdella robusta]ESO05740.1 hypothetical protein HELRODRAFT_171408 [Helobdella robusta]